MIISIIVAASENNIIGNNNKLPWHLPADMKFFKSTTWGLPVIMGRKTFESMNNQPLPGRMNIIISRQDNLNFGEVKTAKNYNEAITTAAESDCNEAFIIGGGEIFKETIKLADRIYMTRVHTNIEGDVFFPEINKNDWKLIKTRDCKIDSKHQYDYTFEVWERTPNASVNL